MPHGSGPTHRTGLTINRAGLRLKRLELFHLGANDVSKGLDEALRALGRHRIDVAHRLALRAIEADARCVLFANFVRSIVRFDNVEAYPGEPGYDVNG